ncbi:MAG: Uncharacterized protein CEN91_451 [Candidatus Berkelbacteria bacterium Licking1014_85]|uniref:Uncharacterized protein n=1 Tax=Candidatus Berkelbacteria bacterium Licking1014_85 TaxID=2017148 RepID=A0A554LHT4_9BACT|nr:MAG: Uncharacterized protein CEN91_451 [Candidatus Berkelbacteria bacterium Licking1014_85]
MLITRYIRGVYSNKLKSSYFLTQAFTPSDADKAEMGTLLSLIEIQKPGLIYSQIGTALANSFHRFYYRGASSSALVNFENAIKSANDYFAKISVEGDYDWVEKTHITILLLKENKIHFTSTGNAKVSLVRDEKVTQINNDNNEEANPLKIYGAITSGSLHENDMLILSSDNFFEIFDSTELKRNILGASLLEGALNLVSSLKKNKNIPVNFILFKTISENNAGLETISETDKVYIDTSNESLHHTIIKFAKNYIAPFGSKTFVLARSKIKKTVYYSKNTLFPEIKTHSSKAWHFVTKNIKNTTQAKILKNATSIISNPNSDSHSIKPQNWTKSIHPAHDLVGKNLFTVHDYRAIEKEKNRKNILNYLIANIFKSIKTFLLLIKKILFLGKKTINSRTIIILGIIALSLFLIGSIKWQKKHSEEKKIATSHKSLIDEATTLIARAQNAQTFNQKEDAKKSYGEAIQKMIAIDNKSEYYTSAQNLKKQAQSEYDKLANIKRLTQKSILSSLSNPIPLFFENQNYYLANKNIYKNNLDQTASILTIDSPSNLIALTKNFNKNIYYCLGSTGDIFEININNKTSRKITPKEGTTFSSGNKVLVYADNIFVLNVAEKQIYKYISSDNEFSGAKKYFTATPSIEKAIDFAIDGSIYILTDDGKVLKYIKGSSSDFNLRNIPEPFNKLEKPVAIYTDENTSSIYILDSGSQKRLIEFSKNGEYIKQYILDNVISELTNMAMDVISKTALIATENEIYQININ